MLYLYSSNFNMFGDNVSMRQTTKQVCGVFSTNPTLTYTHMLKATSSEACLHPVLT